MDRFINIINLVVLFILLIFYIKVVNENNSLKLQIKQEQQKSDSLYFELYPCEIELNRFKIAYEILNERNPKAASQYGDIISLETE